MRTLTPHTPTHGTRVNEDINPCTPTHGTRGNENINPHTPTHGTGMNENINPHTPGPYCFHFSSGATIPNPAGPHVADRGTTPRYEG